jgi:hypothetical protein
MISPANKNNNKQKAKHVKTRMVGFQPRQRQSSSTWAFAQFSANDIAQQIGLVGLSPHASYAPVQEDAQEEPSPVS